MGWNATSAKNITSQRTEERIKDWYVRNYYDLMIPDWEEITMETTHGSIMWRQFEEPDPWELLAAALVAGATEDYVLYAEEGDEEGMKQIEGWFARNAYTQAFFDYLQAECSHCHTVEDWRRLKRSIRIIR